MAKYPVYTECSPPRPSFTSFGSMTSRLRDTGFSKIGNAPNDPRMTLITDSSMLTKTKQNSWKIKNSKFQKSKTVLLWGPLRKKLQKKFERIQKWFGGGVAFWSLAPIGSHVNKSETKSWKIKHSNFQKSKAVLLWGPLRRNFGKRLKGFKSDLREE